MNNTSPSTEDASQHAVLFDDFDYPAPDDPTFTNNGWIVRTGSGWPGVPGAIWRAENVSFVADPDDLNNRLMQMTSSTDERGRTSQNQVCQQRKFYEGTYATRLKFSDSPATGPDGDYVVETFYLISPQAEDLDPDYSELDFEYLPNGSWGVTDHELAATTWETYQLDPWIADNQSTFQGGYVGWHTLVLQIANGTATYYTDGKLLAAHGGKYYPEVPMSINYNLWFISGGQLSPAKARDNIEQVDWVYFAANTVISPENIEGRVADLRKKNVPFTDSVSPSSPPLDSPCNF